MTTSQTSSQPSLLVAVARAENTGTLLRVVDESLRAAAELREAREARRRDERLDEQRRARAEEFERLEREHAERLAKRHRLEAERIVEERDALNTLRHQAEIRDGTPPPTIDLRA